MIIGTAGHIDHGKTALVKALTGVDTDRLPEEKARGITLDLGYAYMRLPSGKTLGFVDVPGHEKLVRNMLAGATGVDYVLLVVAADDGPKPQTIEHLQILNLLGLNRGAVGLTKVDRVDEQRLAQTIAQIRTLLGSTGLAHAPVFPVSSLTGKGIAGLRDFLYAESDRQNTRATSGYFRLAVDRCFTLHGAGTVVTGTVFSGTTAVGDSLLLSPPGIAVRVRSIHAQNTPSQTASAGQRCALNLIGEDFDKSQVARGHWVLAAPVHAPTQRIAVQLTVLSSQAHALHPWTPVHFHLAAAEAMGRVALLEGGQLSPGDTALAEIVLDRPIGALHGDRFVIRDQSALRTIGGGQVLDAFPPTRGKRTPARIQLLRDWCSDDPAHGMQAALALSELGVDVSRFARNWNLTSSQVAAVIQTCGARSAGTPASPVAFSENAWSNLKQKASEALRAEHARTPDMLGVGRERLCRMSFPGLARAAYDSLIAELLEAGAIEQTGAWLHVPGHRVELSRTELTLWQELQPMLEAVPFHPPRVRDLAHALHTDEAFVRHVLMRAARVGYVYPVAHDHYFAQSAVVRLADIVRKCAAEHGCVNAAGFRDNIGTGRKLAIHILEFFDRVGFTRRAGERHVVRQPDLFSTHSDAGSADALAQQDRVPSRSI